jgi:prepilin-type N-terminal cleavage/methylation domain-containing protein
MDTASSSGFKNWGYIIFFGETSLFIWFYRNMRTYIYYKQAFSLVELSIVLVILGLLTGGVLSGRSLVRASELRALTTDLQRYQAATNAFKDKYFAIPGDMGNATSFWGSLGGTGSDATCQAIAATGTATCNGNSDGSLYNAIGSAGGSSSPTPEIYRFWQHLANAGLIKGQYTGYNAGLLSSTETSFRVPGSNLPSTSLGGSTWFMAGTGGELLNPITTPDPTYAGSVKWFSGNYGNNFYVNATSASSATVNSFPLAPEEVWNIDTKLDDGVPGTGTIVSNKGASGGIQCTDKAGIAPPGDAGAVYLLNNTNKDCAFFMVRAF